MNQNRMAQPITRVGRPPMREPVPVVRALVSPPPESVVKCPHCGAARISQWKVKGSHIEGVRKECRACGTIILFYGDGVRLRVIG